MSTGTIASLPCRLVLTSDAPGTATLSWSTNDQLEASRVFNDRFPRYLADLLGRADDVAQLDTTDNLADIADHFMMDTSALRTQTAAEVFSKITPADLTKAAKKQKDAKKKELLKLIAKNWDDLKAWVLGAKVVDEHAGQRDASGKRLPSEQKTAVGMIPLDETVLQMFLDAGWEWGGDWGGRKDYMHFQDESILDQIKSAPKAKGKGKAKKDEP